MAAPLLLLAVLAGCGSVARPTPRPRPTPTPSPTLGLGVLPLGGEVAAPLGLEPPFFVRGQLPVVPRTVRAARVQGDPAAALQQLATTLGVPGPPVDTGSGLAYNLGATTGYQLTSFSGYLQFDYHPNAPVDETGATPSVAAAVAFVEQFLAAKQLPYPGEGMVPLPGLTTVNAADRRVVFQWTQNGYPLVNITGQPEEVYADVAANYRQQLAVVGISGAVPVPLTSAVASYPSTTPALMLQDLNQRLISPDSYLLSPQGQPFPSPSASSGTSGVFISGAGLAVVDSAGFAVPVLVFQVSNRAPVTQFVTCAAATDACAPLRYQSPLPSG